ncbi:hypothetical protein D4M60_03140, partial [Klebsiella pneumoniae]
MFVELVYDKRNFEGLQDAKGIIHGELTKRIHRIFPDADIRVKPMMSLPAINTDASKHEKERIREGANKQVISSQADSLIKISRIWADFFPANNRISLFRLFFPPFLALFPVFTEISPT